MLWVKWKSTEQRNLLFFNGTDNHEPNLKSWVTGFLVIWVNYNHLLLSIPSPNSRKWHAVGGREKLTRRKEMEEDSTAETTFGKWEVRWVLMSEFSKQEQTRLRHLQTEVSGSNSQDGVRYPRKEQVTAQWDLKWSRTETRSERKASSSFPGQVPCRLPFLPAQQNAGLLSLKVGSGRMWPRGGGGGDREKVPHKEGQGLSEGLHSKRTAPGSLPLLASRAQAAGKPEA